MIRCSVYSLATGKILRVLQCLETDIGANLQAGEAWIPFDGNSDATHYVANNLTVAFPTNTNPVATWDWATLSYVDARTLSQVQADQIGALAAAYTVAIGQSVPYVSKAATAQTFQADPESIANVANMQLAFAAAAAVPAGFYWVAVDNTQVPFTYADVQGLAAAMGAQGFTAFARLQLRKAAVRAATTQALALAVVW